MILQRQKPIKIWGKSEKKQEIEVKINGELIYQSNIPEGAFSFHLSPQREMEDATLEIGEHTFKNVDIGEVWLADKVIWNSRFSTHQMEKRKCLRK